MKHWVASLLNGTILQSEPDFPLTLSMFTVTIYNQAGKDIHDNVFDASKLSFPGKGLKQCLCNQKEKQVSKEGASVASLSSEFMSICKKE